ncbi:MAG: hypothetical protein ACTSYK_02760 [Alphaproteobacteria bacterium]
MKWDLLKSNTVPRPPASGRAVAIMAGVGVASGLIASIPSPLPEIRLEDEGLLLNAKGIPLHAGIVFGFAVAIMIWLWVTRDLAKCLLTFAVVLLGWLAAVNTANDIFQAAVGSELFGTMEGAKSNREILGLVVGGVSGAAVGAGLTAFASGISAERIRRPENWVPIVIVGTLLGVLLYPAAELKMLAYLFVPWQALVAASIAFGLTRA